MYVICVDFVVGVVVGGFEVGILLEFGICLWFVCVDEFY